MTRTPTPPSGSLALSLLLFAVALAPAGSYGPQNFNSFAVNTTNLGDGSALASNTGVCSIQGSPDRYLRLTQNGVGNTASSFKLPQLDPGVTIEEFTVTFDVRMSTSSNPADGFTINFGDIPAGNGGGEGGFAMAGGLFVAWDTYSNGGEAKSIEVFANGVSVGNYPQNFTPVNNVWTPVVIHWDSAGLDVTYNGSAIATNLATPGFVPDAGDRFAFSGRTGGANQDTFIDNLEITTGISNPILTGGPIINEFVADNEDSLEDEDLDSPDWLEIYNGQNAVANLAGHYLTNDPMNLTLWPVPAVSMSAFGYLKVFCSGKDRSDPAGVLHTNFTLPKAGGYLALVAPDGTTVLSQYTYGQQAEDVAYGELGDARTLGFLETPTPCAKNSGLQAAGPPAEDVEFDRTGGVFNGSTTLTILPTVSPTAVVRYTTNNTIPDENSTVYNGSTFNITDTTTIRARVFEPGRLPGEVKSRTLIEIANDIATFNSALPIVVADSDSVFIDGVTNPNAPRPFRPVYTVVIDKDPADGFARMTTPPDFTGRGGMHVRGQSSSGFPKKQYAWETWDNEDNDKNVSILGMPSESDWILHAPYSDKTLMRNVLVYNCARELYGDGGGMRTKFVELFFNQDGGAVTMADYRGVYVIIEKIKRDGDRVDIAKLNESVTDPALITGGYIFKKDKSPWSQPWNTATEGVPLDTHDPQTLNAAQFSYLTGYVNQFEAALHSAGFADPATGYAAYIDVLSFIDNHLFVELFKEIDGYRISQYFSKDRDEKIRALPVWDYNLALGNANYLQGQNATGWYYPQLGGTDYYWYQRLFQDPEFVLAYWDRFWELRRSKFTNTNLLAKIDAYDAELDAPNAVGESATTRNFNEWNILGSYVWPNADGFGSRTTHQSEVDWMKNWLTSRLAWVETQSQGVGGNARPPTWNQYGGNVSAAFGLTMSDPNGWGGAQIYYTTDGTDPRGASGMLYTSPVILNSSQEIRARVTDGSRWSPMSQGVFVVAALPASSSTIVISELDYRPASPSAAEIGAGFTSRGQFEYVELMNVHPSSPVSLEGCAFIDGITFTFDAGVPVGALVLPPGGRVVLVRDAAAFNFRHGAAGAIVAGTYPDAFSNDGERVELVDNVGATIHAFTYNDQEPWPVDADGNGYTMVLIAPTSTPTPDHDSPFSWRSSVAMGGTPGGGDAVAFAGTPGADDDNDGDDAFLEFATGGDDADGGSRSYTATTVEAIDVGGTVGDYLVFEFRVSLAADGALFAIQKSETLIGWTDAMGDFVHLSTSNNGDGTAMVRYRSALTFPFSGILRWFYRLQVSERP